MELIRLFVIAFVIPVHTFSTIQEKCTVSTTYGVLESNVMTSRSNREICAFLGIPFAAPPIGNLRFLPPVSPPSWDGIRNCAQEGKFCLQKNYGGSEDCLYLNVFTHTNNHDEFVPVMVFIHGGGFHLGSSSVDRLGPEYLMDRDIVLVTLQYRLGVFGFLSTEDDVIPGNMGLKDQVKALQWVQGNIKAFGGDPARVTIFGSSAGGASVHLHMQSAVSRDLFSRAISQSGTALSSFARNGKGKSRKDAEHIALSLNCPTNSSVEILRCLQTKDAVEIISAFRVQLVSKYGFNKIFRPVIEVPTSHAFLTTNPNRAATEKPWLVGVNANEGLFKINMTEIDQTINFIRTDFNEFGPQSMFVNDLYSNLDEIANMTYNFYFKNSSTTDSTIRALEQVISDSWFVWPTHQAVLRHSGPLYYYLNNHSVEYSFSQYFDGPQGLGVCHLDELRMLFKQNIFPELNEEDTSVSKLLVNLWVDFATEGNPMPHPVSTNPETKSTGFTWTTFTASNPSYFRIQTNNLSMDTNMFSERMNFWDELALKFIERETSVNN